MSTLKQEQLTDSLKAFANLRISSDEAIKRIKLNAYKFHPNTSCTCNLHNGKQADFLSMIDSQNKEISKLILKQTI